MTPHVPIPSLPPLDAILSAETMLTSVHTLVTDALRQVRQAKRALLDASPVDLESTTSPASLAHAILDVLEAKGPLTFKQLYEELPGFTWNVVYREVKRPKGLIASGLVTHAASGPDRGLVRLAEGVATSALVDPYLQDILDRDSTLTADSDIAKDAASVMRAYTEGVIWTRNNGRRLKAFHLLKSIGNHGLVKTISKVTGGKKPTPGFLDCIAAGIPEATMETLVIKHPDLFPKDLHDRVVRRMAEAEAAAKADDEGQGED